MEAIPFGKYHAYSVESVGLPSCVALCLDATAVPYDLATVGACLPEQDGLSLLLDRQVSHGPPNQDTLFTTPWVGATRGLISLVEVRVSEKSHSYETVTCAKSYL